MEKSDIVVINGKWKVDKKIMRDSRFYRDVTEDTGVEPDELEIPNLGKYIETSDIDLLINYYKNDVLPPHDQIEQLLKVCIRFDMGKHISYIMLVHLHINDPIYNKYMKTFSVLDACLEDPYNPILLLRDLLSTNDIKLVHFAMGNIDKFLDRNKAYNKKFVVVEVYSHRGHSVLVKNRNLSDYIPVINTLENFELLRDSPIGIYYEDTSLINYILTNANIASIVNLGNGYYRFNSRSKQFDFDELKNWTIRDEAKPKYIWVPANKYPENYTLVQDQL